MTNKQRLSIISETQDIIDRKRKQLQKEPERLKRNLLNAQIKGREAMLQKLLDT